MKANWFIVPVTAFLINSAVPAKAATAEELQAAAVLAKANQCIQCHRGDKDGPGPLFRDIAARYKSDAAAREILAGAIKKGSKAKWTQVSRGIPMPPYAKRLSDAEIRQLVEWTLNQ